MKYIRTVLYTAFLTFCLSLTAFAAAPAPHVDEHTTMEQLRANPAIQGTGYYTYCRESNPWEVEEWKNKTLGEYFEEYEKDPGIAALNLIIDNYNRGVKVTWQLYTPEEIAADSSLGSAQLYYYPSDQPNAKVALVVPGNMLMVTSEMREGGSAAWELHKMGYAVFVLRYRTFPDLGKNAPLEDVARAVRLITEQADTLGICPEDYALVGFSSGGQLSGVFANEEKGYGHYGLPRPGALLLAYPVVNFSEVKLLYHASMDTGDYSWHYYWPSVADMVTDDYPPVYFWYGKNDATLPWMINSQQGPMLQKALEEHHVPYVLHVYEDAAHGVGTGIGTDAEGWLAEAAAFWMEHTA